MVNFIKHSQIVHIESIEVKMFGGASIISALLE